MFSFAADNNSSDEEAELDFGPNTSTSNSAGLGNLFGSERHTAASNSKLVYQAPKQPGSGAETKMRTVEIVQEKEEEKLEVMSNVRSGVKMATAVSAYKYENGGYESLGKLGLAIIGKKESNCYQVLLYRGKQSAVAVANIGPRFVFRVQQDNYANFVDEGSKSWTVCFDSQDVLINFAKQILLCKAMFSKEAELCSCELGPGEGREVELGDSLEVQLTSWMVDHQSLSRMIETTRNKEKGLRFKLGGRNYFSGLEAAIVGMKKGGRKFIIAPSENGRTAFDVEITKVKAVDQERKVPIEVTATNNNNNNILERVAKVGQPVVSRSKETPSEMPELEEVSAPRSVSAFSTPKSSRRHSHQEERRTTPIPILRADSPASLRSGHSAASGGQQLPVRVTATQPQPQLGVSQGAEFTMLMSEARLQNTEMRMNIQRVSDKVDTLISKGNSGAGEDVTRKLDTILEQNKEIKHLLETSRAAAGAGSSNESMSEEYMLKQQKLRRLEETLQEKEQQLEQRQLRSEERVAELQHQLEEAQQLVARTQLAARTEVRKLLSSTAKLLLAQFPSSEEAEYSGARVRDTIGHTFHLIGDRLQEKYGSGSSVPVAAVAPVPAEVEEWDAESDAE